MKKRRPKTTIIRFTISGGGSVRIATTYDYTDQNPAIPNPTVMVSLSDGIAFFGKVESETTWEEK